MRTPERPLEAEASGPPDERVPFVNSAIVIASSFALFAVLVFGMTSMTPDRKAARGAATAAAVASAALAATNGAPLVSTAASLATPAATPTPTAPPTPFVLVPSPVRGTATFTVEPGHDCPGLPPRVSDTLIFSVTGGILTIRQPSTGGVSVGPIDPSGEFAVQGQVVHESYAGRITGATASAANVLQSGSCTATYQVAVRFLIG